MVGLLALLKNGNPLTWQLIGCFTWLRAATLNGKRRWQWKNPSHLRGIIVYLYIIVHLIAKCNIQFDEGQYSIPLSRTNLIMENPAFEDVFPIEQGDFPMSC